MYMLFSVAAVHHLGDIYACKQSVLAAVSESPQMEQNTICKSYNAVLETSVLR